ncbi:MAG: methionyl-tRNA formyltransferase [Christensenellaceae bacterium]|jgi:methionyl-tRNA formyltransferase|nr:methionyl-tRNA formyltransferase [Christensenellaceae bacterium]
MKVIFAGTTKFALRILNAIEASKHQILAVVTQSDKINSRGNKIVDSPIKAYANEMQLKLFQFESISRDGFDILAQLQADIMVTAAYGQILSDKLLSLFKHGIINVHASTLPKYRGPAPVQYAIMNGDEELGVTIMQTVKQIDAGDIIATGSVKLDGSENADEALEKLAPVAANTLVSTLDLIENGQAQRITQDASRATFTKMLNKIDGRIIFNKSAQDIVNFVRAYNPNPGAYITSDRGRLRILRASAQDIEHNGIPGEVVRVDKTGISIKCANGVLLPLIVQADGKKEMPIDAYLRGNNIKLGYLFNSEL